MEPNTLLLPELPFVWSPTPVPPAPIVTVYPVEGVTVNTDSAEAPPPDDSPTTEER
jgi:hypothetical protein